MEFITRSTKIKTIVASALIGVALITLIMLSCLLQISTTARTLMCFIYTVSLLMMLIFYHGIIQIQVFTDYKSQKKHLCADGVLSICLSSLLTISAILFGILQASDAIKIGFVSGTGSADIRLFLIAFLAVMTFWKLYVMILSIKEKRFNWWGDMLNLLLWLALTVLMIVSLFLKGATLVSLSWVFVSVSWVLICLTIFQTLYSYVFRDPDYLETSKAIALKEKADQEYENRQRRLDSSYGVSESRIEEKLNKLKELADEGFITKQEFAKRRKELLDREL